MRIESTSPAADAKVTMWVTGMYRSKGSNVHLRNCPDLTLSYEGYDGTYGCDTGCEYLRLECEASCPHGEREEYEYGDFGELSYLLEDIERDQG